MIFWRYHYPFKVNVSLSNFTKWLEAMDQIADTIRKELIVVFGRFGIPKFLRSDQGCDFESTLLRSTPAAFRVEKDNSLSSTRRRNGGEGK